MKKIQGLKKARKSIQEYTEEFYRVLIRIDHAKVDKEKVSHYINGLRPSIHELHLVQIMNIEEVYQFSLKVEEKLNKKYDNKNSGRGRGGRSRG